MLHRVVLEHPLDMPLEPAPFILAFVLHILNYPARACASKGLCDRSWCPYIIYCLDFFWNQSFISKNTHFEMSILTQIGFSSNLMASGTVQQLDKSSWPSQIPIVYRLGKGSPIPETHVAPNHTPTIADFVPKWLNTPTLLYYYTGIWLAPSSCSFYGLWILLGR